MAKTTNPFAPGDVVKVLSESYGWGLGSNKVQPGDVGVVVAQRFLTGAPAYQVEFPQNSSWYCQAKDLLMWPPQTAAQHKLSMSIKAQSMAQTQHTIYDPLALMQTAQAIQPKPTRRRLPSTLKGAKVGSKVLVTSSNNACFTIGQVVEVREIQHDGKSLRAYNPEHGTTYWLGFDECTTDLTGAPGKVSFESVILAEDKKAKIMATIKQIDNYGLIFDQWGFGSVLEKGKAVSMLFYGEPGTGKTLMAQAIADQYSKKLKFIGSAEIESSEPGQAERNIKAFFEGADKDTILLFDECDSLVYSREQVGSILAAQVNQLLSSLETFEGIVVFTTNRLGQLDEAFNRRLSLKVHFAKPNAAERLKIWQRMFPKKAPLADDIDWERLAEVDITGGYIKNVVLRAARMAAAEEIKAKDKKITMRHLVDALTDEAESLIEFEEARSHNHTPRLMGGGVQRSMGRNVSMGAGR